MKQRISVTHFKQITSEQQNKLKVLWSPEIFDVCFDIHDGGIYSIGTVRKNYEIKGKRDTWFWFSDEGSSALTKTDVFPLLSIGQCIQILNDNHYDWPHEIYYDLIGENFIDALWEAVKGIL